MPLLRVLGREIVNFHERLTNDKTRRRGIDEINKLIALPVTAGCLVVACTESEEIVRAAFPHHNIVLCEGSMSLVACLERLHSRPEEILVASSIVQCALLLNVDHLRKVATCCRRKLWLRRPHSWLAERQLRVALHRTGYYEVAHCMFDQANSQYDRSSVGLYPNGEFQMLDRRPGVAEGQSVDWLIASRIPLLETAQLPWKWVYGEGLLDADGYVSAASAEAPILAVTGTDRSPTGSNGIHIQARMRWQYPVAEFTVGSLVGCYCGPGDSNMYLAMVEPHTQHQLTASLWRNMGSWQQISRTPFSLPQADCLQLSDYSSVDVTLEITQDRLCLHCNGEVVLSAEDNSIPRNECHGVRMLGAQLQVGQIEAYPL